MRLIDDLLKEGKKVIDNAKRPFIISKLERSFQSAIDSAKEVEVDENLKIQELRLKLVETPESAEDILNKIIVCKEKIRKAKITIEIVEEEQKLLFSEVKTKKE